MPCFQCSKDGDEWSSIARRRLVMNITALGQTFPVTVETTSYSISTSSRMEKLMEIFKFLTENVIPVMSCLLQTILQGNTNINRAPAFWIFLASLSAYSILHLIAMIFDKRNNGGFFFFYTGASVCAIIALFSFFSLFIPTRFTFISALSISVPVIVAVNWDRNWNAAAAARMWISTCINYLIRYGASPEVAVQSSLV